MKTIRTQHTLTNDTDKFLLVGNCSEVIAAYDTQAEAEADIDNQCPCICESKWGSVRIVSPGETVQGDYCQPAPETPQDKIRIEKEWAKLPWMIPTEA
jgi:hypothetical protein